MPFLHWSLSSPRHLVTTYHLYLILHGPPPPLGYITGQSDMGERQRTSGLRAFLHLFIFPCFTSALHQTMVLERLKTHRGQGPVGQGAIQEGVLWEVSSENPLFL